MRLEWPRLGAGDSLVAVAASTHGRRRGEALAFFFFSPRRTVCTARGEDDRVSGGGDGKPRATRGAGIIIHVVSKAYPWSQRPQRGLVSSCGFQFRWFPIIFYEIVHWHVGRSFVESGSSGPGCATMSRHTSLHFAASQRRSAVAQAEGKSSINRWSHVDGITGLAPFRTTRSVCCETDNPWKGLPLK